LAGEARTDTQPRLAQVLAVKRRGLGTVTDFLLR